MCAGATLGHRAGRPKFEAKNTDGFFTVGRSGRRWDTNHKSTTVADQVDRLARTVTGITCPWAPVPKPGTPNRNLYGKNLPPMLFKQAGRVSYALTIIFINQKNSNCLSLNRCLFPWQMVNAKSLVTFEQVSLNN